MASELKSAQTGRTKSMIVVLVGVGSGSVAHYTFLSDFSMWARATLAGGVALCLGMLAALLLRLPMRIRLSKKSA
jgi:hypothetical protein